MSLKSLQFHIESDDYFGTLATVLDLVRQKLNSAEQKWETDVLRSKVKELMILQKDYRIVKK